MIAVQKQIAARAYEAGATLEELGQDFGRSHVAIWKWLKTTGVATRRAGSRRKPMFELVYLRAHGASYKEIAQRVGLCDSCIRIQLLALGTRDFSDLLSLNSIQLSAYREALDVDRLSHDDAMEVAREVGREVAA